MKFVITPLLIVGVCGEWTPPFSDEGGEGSCNGLVKGFHCTDRYCDNLKLECATGWDVDSQSGQWTHWFTDGSPSTGLWSPSTGLCPQDKFVTKMQCRNRYCDDVRIFCAKVPNSVHSNCRWRDWQSDESGPKSFPEGSFMKGARCSGSFCDNMQFYVCDLKQRCEVESAFGTWKYIETISGSLSFTYKWGITDGGEHTKTKEWQDSMTASISTGFNILVLSGEASISRTTAMREAEVYKEAWTRTEGGERTLSFEKSEIGNVLWKWEFYARDSCSGNTNTEIVTRDYAITEGAWREPCCLPGYGLDHHYKQCHSNLISKEDYCSSGRLALGPRVNDSDVSSETPFEDPLFFVDTAVNSSFVSNETKIAELGDGGGRRLSGLGADQVMMV